MSALVVADWEVTRWAEFSGDWNPIHFKGDATGLVGVEYPFAHGMLSMLHVKERVGAAAALAFPDAPWLQLDFRLRAPVPINTELSLDLDPVQPRRLSGTVALGSNGKPLIYIAASPSDTDRLAIDRTGLTGRVSSGVPADLSQHDLLNSLPLWMQWEAQLFRDAFDACEPRWESGRAPEAFSSFLSDPTSCAVLLHTRHTVELKRSLIEGDPAEFPSYGDAKKLFKITKISEDRVGANLAIAMWLTVKDHPVLLSTANVALRVIPPTQESSVMPVVASVLR